MLTLLQRNADIIMAPVTAEDACSRCSTENTRALRKCYERFAELTQQTLTEGEAESRNATVFEEWPKSTAIFLKRLSGKTDILKHIANAGCAPQVKTTSWLGEKKKNIFKSGRVGTNRRLQK